MISPYLRPSERVRPMMNMTLGPGMAMRVNAVAKKAISAAELNMRPAYCQPKAKRRSAATAAAAKTATKNGALRQ